MQFSWKSLNYLINLNNISFHEFQQKLTLAGFEIEDIEYNDQLNDKLIKLSITSNRKDEAYYMGLIDEITTIFQQPLKIKLTNSLNYSYLPQNIHQEYELFPYIKINIIHYRKEICQPKWMNTYFNQNNHSNISLLNLIKKYIKIKWNQDIQYFSINENLIKNNINHLYQKLLIQLKKQNNTNELYINNHKLTELNDIKNNKYILLYLPMNKKQYLNHFINSYDELIYLLGTYTNSTISKSYDYIDNILYNKKQKIIFLKEKIIHDTLGPIKKNNNTKLENLHNKKIISILNRLYLKPKYNFFYKHFINHIPTYKINDLQREIDIVEEIGRIYGFHHFLDNIPNIKKKGKISKKTYYIKKIRSILRNLGLNEIVNTSLSTMNKNQYTLYNPMIEEQKCLRNNLLEGIINNYLYNIKINRKNNHIELFEIGKIFPKKNIFHEEINIAGIIHNNHYHRNDWKEKIHNMNWFHAKGLLEIFLETLEVKINWNYTNHYSSKFQNINHLFHDNNKLLLYNMHSQEPIGLFGQINNSLTSGKNNCYIFEINLNNLINSINHKSHLNYNIQSYSIYPLVTRDINIQVNYRYNFEELKEFLISNNKDVIESIYLLNAYNNSIKKIQSLCLRINYRSKYKTLTNDDIQKIEEKMIVFINKFSNSNVS